MPTTLSERVGLQGHAELALEESYVLGYNVERLRKAQSINKTVFSTMAGISRPTLNKIENGMADLQLSVISRIARALGTTTLELLTPPPDPAEEAEKQRALFDRRDIFNSAAVSRRRNY